MISILKSSKRIVCAVALSALLLPVVTFSQETVSFSVSPTIYDMTAAPGQMWQSTVRIVNPNSFPITLSITPNNFIPKDEDGIPQFIELDPTDTSKDSLAEWLSLQSEITVEPEQAYELPFLITVPPDAPPGGHYAALMISTQTAKNSGEVSLVQTSQVISALIFLKVTGQVTEAATVRSFRTANYMLSAPETRFEIRIENKGNIHLQPQGEIKIYNMWGAERGTIPINQQTMLGNVLPQSVRKFSFDWTSDWTIADIGRYTAEATLAYGTDGRQFMSADTAFWVIPWKLILLCILVIGGLIATITWAIKLYIKHVLALAGVTQGAPTVVVEKQLKSHVVRKKVLSARDVTAPLGVSILDLRRELQQSSGTWRTTITIYLDFMRQWWKLLLGCGALILLLLLIWWFFASATSDERQYAVTDPLSGASIHNTTQTTEDALQQASGTPIKLVNRTGNQASLEQIADKALSIGFTIATTTEEQGAPEEKTVIVYSPENSEEALLLSRTLNNALLSAFTVASHGEEQIIVYIGDDALVTP